jgi:hypothetical protein
MSSNLTHELLELQTTSDVFALVHNALLGIEDGLTSKLKYLNEPELVHFRESVIRSTTKTRHKISDYVIRMK